MQPSVSKAAVFRGHGQPLILEELPIPVLAAGETLVRIRCATICASDLHTVFGRRSGPAPAVLGHEMVGEIAAAGAGGALDFQGEPLIPGDRVTWSMVWSCGACGCCRQGLRPFCERLFKFGHAPLRDGRGLTGAYAEYCHLPAGTALFRVPASVPDVVAAPANCAAATVAAVLRQAGSVRGATVLIAGTGMLGATACAMAHAEGASLVLATDRIARRAEMATRFGAQAIDPSDSLAARILQATGGRGLDLILEFAGAPEAVEASLPLLRPGGHLLLAGAVFPTRPVALPAETIVRRMLHISGVYNYDPSDLSRALEFLEANQTLSV
jgi:alcohol dehydrogenase